MWWIRSWWDSRTPVRFLAFSSCLNIVLDLVFIRLLGFGVEGPAAATLISQAISGGICAWYIRRKYPILRMSKEERRQSIPNMRRLLLPAFFLCYRKIRRQAA